MAIVWPCSLSVDEYVAAGREVEVPRADCPSCSEPMTFWSGYWRFVRHEAGRASKIWVRRGRVRAVRGDPCPAPGVRGDRTASTSVETIGAVLETVIAWRRRGPPGGRASRGPPHHGAGLACGAFGRRAAALAVAFAALAVELGGEAVDAAGDPMRRRARRHRRPPGGPRVRCRDGWPSGGGASARRCAGGRLARHQHELALSRRRQTSFHASCPMTDHETGETTWTTTTPRRWRCTAGR